MLYSKQRAEFGQENQSMEKATQSSDIIHKQLCVFRRFFRDVFNLLSNSLSPALHNNAAV